jgi:hypothetical protein
LQSQLQALQRDAGEIDSFLAEVSLAGAAGAHAVVYPALFDVAAATASPMKHAGHVQVSQGVGERSHLDALVEKAVPYTTLPYASQVTGACRVMCVGMQCIAHNVCPSNVLFWYYLRTFSFVLKLLASLSARRFRHPVALVPTKGLQRT